MELGLELELVDKISLGLLGGMVVVFLASFVLDRSWWSRFWSGVSSLLDPLRAQNWLLGPVTGIIWLAAVGALAGVTRSLPLTALFVVLTWIFVIWFFRARYQAYRYRKALRNGFSVDMSINKTSEGIGLLDRWAGSVKLPKRSILVAGASGSGKTEAAKHMVQQMLFDQSSLILVYDHKDDFQAFFDELDIEYIRISMDENARTWNLFREFDTARDIDEFARALFPTLSGGDNDFFDDMARQVFAACLKMMVRNTDETNDLTNETVRDYFRSSGVADVYNDLHDFPDFQAAASAIDVEASPRQAQGVYSSVQRIVNKVFMGNFGTGPSEKEGYGFSIRGHVEDPQGVPVVLDFPKAAGQSTKPIFRFLIDHAAMFAMQDADNQSYFVLDEFAQIPHLRRLEELVNVGRGEKVTTLVTLQSVQQLYRNYDRDGGESVLSGLVSMILLRPNDPATVEFYRSAIGTDFTEYTQHVEEEDFLDREKREVKDVEEHPFSTGEIRRWDPGVGVVIKQSGWLHGYIPLLTDDTIDVVTTVLAPRDRPTELPAKTVDGALESNDTASDDKLGDHPPN